MAMPINIPRGHAVLRGTQSAITNVIKTTLIWPKSKFDLIGSRNITAGATMAAVNHTRRCHAAPVNAGQCSAIPRPVTRIQIETISSRSVTTVIMALAAGSDSHANGANTIAASGG